MNNQNLLSMQGANGRFVPPPQPTWARNGPNMAGPPPLNMINMGTHPGMAHCLNIMGPQPSLIPNMPYQQMGPTPHLMGAAPTAMMGHSHVGMTPMLNQMMVPLVEAPHPMAGMHIPSNMVAAQRSDTVTSAPDPGQDIKNQVLSLAGLDKELMEGISTTGPTRRRYVSAPEVVISLQQPTAGSAAPAASQAIATQEPAYPIPSITLLTGPTLRKRRNSMPTTLTYDYFLEPVTETSYFETLNTLADKLDGDGMRLLYGIAQYFNYAHRDLLQFDADYEIRKQQYEVTKNLRDENSAKYCKMEKENEDMKRQHTYDAAKIEFLDQTLTEQWPEIRNLHPELPTEALSSHLFKERDDLRTRVQELETQLNAHDGARENLLAQKWKLEDESRSLKEEIKALHERYQKRLNTVGRHNQSRETKLRHSFDARIEELLEKARNSEDSEAVKKLVDGLEKEKQDTSTKGKEKLQEVNEQLVCMNQSGKGHKMKGNADATMLKEKLVAAKKAMQHAEETAKKAEIEAEKAKKTAEEAAKKLEDEKKRSEQLKIDKRSQAEEMSRLQDRCKSARVEVESLKKQTAVEKKAAGTEIKNARNEAKQYKLNCEKLREEIKEARKGGGNGVFEHAHESREETKETCLRVSKGWW